MIDLNGMAYNRFYNLENIEDRIIYYLLSPNNKTPDELKYTHYIWRILMYNDIDALNMPLPKYKDVVNLIENDNTTWDDKRIFRTPRLEDGWKEVCTMLKIYVDTIVPTNHLLSLVNIGVDVVCHNKIINVNVPRPDREKTETETYDETITNLDVVDGIVYKPTVMSRVTLITKCVLYLLNGAELAGVGRMQFNRERSRYNLAQYGIWNNRDYEGIKIVMGVNVSGVS